MRSYYIIVKSELICVIGSVKSDMRSHEFEEKRSKTLWKRENNYSK